MKDMLNKLRGGLIVSCQAEGDDPFNRPEYIALFARAAEMGGAVAIRAREPDNIRAIRAAVKLPIIGLTKGTFPDGSVLITPDFDDAAAIIGAGADIVAVDATRRTRPNGLRSSEFIAGIKKSWNVPVMADCSTLQEAVSAAQAGADLVGTTLSGYTPYTNAASEDEPNWDLLAEMVASVQVPVIVEGRVSTPAHAARAIEMGAFAVVVGTVITRPRVMVRKFAEAVRESAA